MKRIFDLFFACILVLLLLPFLLLIAFAIRISSPGPILFKQKRIGLNGKVFLIYKFRSMVSDAEFTGTGLFSFDNDPRITFVGKFLRQYSLDELPQLFNIINGSMSLVGPRPPVTYELGPWDSYTPYMRRRFKVKPGITGLAQVSGRNQLSWDEKLYYDNKYVDLFLRRGLFVDLYILFKTFYVVIAAFNTVESERSVDDASNTVSGRAYSAGRPDKN